MTSAIISKAYLLQFILKSMIFICFAILFYIFYFTDIVDKFAERDTTLIYSQETVEENEMNSPFITFCTNPRAKSSIIEKYKLSPGILDEPNSNDKKILISLNKTVEDLFREATYMLNVDFCLFVTFWYYESKDGWTQYKKELFEGTENYVKVYIKNTIILMFYL